MVLPRLRRPDHGRVNIIKASYFVLLLVILVIVFLPKKGTTQQTTANINKRNFNYFKQVNYSDISVGHDFEVEEECLQFGCHVYPAELTPEVYSHLKASFIRNSKHQTYPFANDNMLILTQQGASHHENQDRASIIDPFMISSSSSNMVINGTLICLFDGHGVEGHIVASHVLHEFPQLLASKLEALRMSVDHDEVADTTIIRILKESFVEVDIYGTPNFLFGGTTGSVTLRLGSKLYIANVGDSQTMVFSMPNGTIRKTTGSLQDVDIQYATRKDKAILPDERERIEKLGGKIHVNPNTNHSVVVVYSRAARDTIMLAMSRSIGDWEWKAVGVTAEPIVDVIDIKQLPPNSFLMAASDGVWDMRRKQFYGKQFGECFFPVAGKLGGGYVHPLAKGLEVFDTITPKVQKGYRDDMTAILLGL